MKWHLAAPLKAFPNSFASIAEMAFLEDRFEILMLIQNHILLQVNLQ